jgi:hypothetical protein
MFFEANIGLCASDDMNMVMYGGFFFINMHILGNVIRGTTMSKVVVHVITLS